MNDKFKKRIQSNTSDILEKINQIDLLKDKWISGAKLDPQVLTNLKKSVLVTSTGASTRIEGSSLSDDDVERLMKGLSLQKFADRDKEEVRGYFELLTNVFETYNTIPFSESTIKFFHKELLKYVEKDKPHRGKYKSTDNKVAMVSGAGEPEQILFDTTEAWRTPKEMTELVEWTQNAFLEKEVHPILVIANFVVEFLKIHPFTDGNGRLSRILTNLLLLQHGYSYVPYISHEKLIENNKIDYYLALRNSQKTFNTENENLKPWLNFFLSILNEQATRAIELISATEVSKLLSVQQQKVWEYISKQDTEVTPIEISKATKVPRPTVSQAINKLQRIKWIERIGLGRGTRYRKTK